MRADYNLSQAEIMALQQALLEKKSNKKDKRKKKKVNDRKKVFVDNRMCVGPGG